MGVRARIDDAVRDLLQDRRLARLGGRNHHASLALPDRGNHVDDPLRNLERAAFQPETLVREERRELVEVRTCPCGLDVHAVHAVQFEQREVLLIVLRPPNLAGDGVALAQREPPNLRERHVDVLGPGQISRGSQEPVTLGQDVEQAGQDGGVLQFLRSLRLFAEPALLADPTPVLSRGSSATLATAPLAVVATVRALALRTVSLGTLIPRTVVAGPVVARAVVAGTVVARAACPRAVVRPRLAVGRYGGLGPSCLRIGRPLGRRGRFGRPARVRHDRVDEPGLAQLLSAFDAHALRDLLQLGDQFPLEDAAVRRRIHEAMPLPSTRSGAWSNRPGTSRGRCRSAGASPAW